MPRRCSGDARTRPEAPSPVSLGLAPTSGRTLRFEVRTDTPDPYTIIWKVRNRGQRDQLGKLRGRLIHNSGWRHTETSRYRGLHYVEAYIVRAGIVVATDRVVVNIM